MWIWLFASFLDFSVDLSFGHVDSFVFYSIHFHFHMSKAPFSLIIQSLKLLVSPMKWCPGLKYTEMLLFCSRMNDSKYSVFVLKMAPEERPHGCQNPAQILNTLCSQCSNMLNFVLTRLLFYTTSAQEEEEHFPWCLWHQVWPCAHAETGSVQAADTEDEGSKEEEGRGGHKGAGGTGTQGGQSRELRQTLYAFWILLWLTVCRQTLGKMFFTGGLFFVF